jgi:predicted ATP-dependent endonuclease of OLD family
MRLIKARVQNYRSIIDTGEFDVEELKSILVGPNEAGKTVLLQALQQLNKPPEVDGFDPLRDYPRSKYNEITTGKVKPEDVTIVVGYFKLEDEDKELIPKEFHQCQYKLYRSLDNKSRSFLVNAPEQLHFSDIKKSLIEDGTYEIRQNCYFRNLLLGDYCGWRSLWC